MVGLTPFFEQQSVWQQISRPFTDTLRVTWPAMGPAPNNINYEPWRTQIGMLLCPSDLPPNGLMGDGAVKFITESVDTGNTDQGPVGTAAPGAPPVGSGSNYGIWGAAGSISGRQTTSLN